MREPSARSSHEHASATGLLDSLLSGLREKLGLDDHGDLGEGALAEDLEEALRMEVRGFKNAYSLGHVDHGGLAVLASLSLGPGLLRDQRPELVDVDAGRELLVSLQSELSHTTLTEVSGVAIAQS